jgi:hypothetical protein
VEGWKDSGLSAKEFAAQVGLNPSTLTYWSWKLRAAGAAVDGAADGSSASDGDARRRKRRRAAKNAPRFVEVRAASITPPSTTCLEFVMSSGVCLRIPADFDEVTLVRVMRAVEAAR